jgi:membrane protease YdiL (CAAX protease family)
MKDNPSQKETPSAGYSAALPLSVFLFSLIVLAVVLTFPTLIFHWSKDYQTNHLYLIGTLGQLLIDLPAIYFFFRTTAASAARTSNKRRMASFLAGLLLAAVLAGFRILFTGRVMEGRFMGGVPAFTQSLSLAAPWNFVWSAAAFFAYGPGEAIFVVYLIQAFDQALGGSPSAFSRGVVITSILWALPHLLNIFYFGLGAIPNTIIMFFLGLLMGSLLKRTRSAWGPVIFWTLVNGTSF